MVGLWKHLVLLRDGELPERAEVAVVVVAPDTSRRRDHRILARQDPGIVGTPPAGVDDHVVAESHSLDAVADRVDDSCGVASTEVEVARVARALAHRDDVDRSPPSRPDVVEVDPRGHHGDEHLARARCRRFDLLHLECATRLAEAILPDDLCEHARRHVAHGREHADRNGLAHG